MFAGRFSSSIGTVGVDFGSGVMKLLQLRDHNGTLQVVGAARCRLDGEGEGQPAAEALAEQVRSAFATGGFTGRRCVVALPRNQVRVQSIRLPQMPEAELRQAIEWEASQRFGFDRESMQADCIRTGALLQSGESREEILLIAASHATVHSHIDPLMEAGLRPVAIDTGFAALARTVSRRCRRESDRDQVRAVVEVGASGSVMMILRGDQIAFCKTIDIGGQKFNEAVADHLQMDNAAAAELRAERMVTDRSGREEGPELDESTSRAVYEATRPLMGDLTKEVMLCLRYYGVTFRGHPPDRIVLTGGDGLEPRLDESLKQACGIEVVLDDGSGGLESFIPQIHQKLNRSPGPLGAWAVAGGLSLRGISRFRSAEDPDVPQQMRRGAAA